MGGPQKGRPWTGDLEWVWVSSPITRPIRPRVETLYSVRLLASRWERAGSNRRPPACKAGALPTELRSRESSRCSKGHTALGQVLGEMLDGKVFGLNMSRICSCRDRGIYFHRALRGVHGLWSHVFWSRRTWEKDLKDVLTMDILRTIRSWCALDRTECASSFYDDGGPEDIWVPRRGGWFALVVEGEALVWWPDGDIWSVRCEDCGGLYPTRPPLGSTIIPSGQVMTKRGSCPPSAIS